MRAYGADYPRPNLARTFRGGCRLGSLVFAVVAALAQVPLPVSTGLPSAGAEISKLITPGVGIGPIRLGVSVSQVTALLGRPGSSTRDGQLTFPQWIMTVSVQRETVVRVSTASPLFRTTRGAGVGVSHRQATQLINDAGEPFAAETLTATRNFLTVLYPFRGIGFVFRADRAVEVFVVPALTLEPSVRMLPGTQASRQAGVTSNTSAGNGAGSGGGGAGGGGAPGGGQAMSTSADTPAWSGIIDPTRAIDWSQAGIPGGIPSGSWTQSGATITAAQCGNGTSDCTSTIQAALSACGTNQYVLLGPGTFLLNGGLTLTKSYCVLRGSGPQATILNAMATTVNDIHVGQFTINFANALSIIGGTQQGSTQISVSNTAGVTVGGYLLISQLNDGTIVTSTGTGGNCNWCDGGWTSDGSRAQEQIVEVQAIPTSTTVVISPGLFTSYTRTPQAVPFAASVKYTGVENLQIYANNTHTSNKSSIAFSQCAYCWVSNVESNFTDGNHIDMDDCFRCEVVDSYFWGTYGTGPGGYDHGMTIEYGTTLSLIQNNIFDRTGIIEPEYGPAGNVIAYNFKIRGYSTASPSLYAGEIEAHGAHAQYNLYEGNQTGGKIYPDNFWGSSADETFFRNWVMGANLNCNPQTGLRGPVVCTPTGPPPPSFSNGWYETEAVRAFDIEFLDTSFNFVGDVIGSDAMNALTVYDNGTTLMGHVPLIAWPTSRDYSNIAYGFSFGYNGNGDDGKAAGDNTSPYSTAFIHGVYNHLDGSTTWVPGVTQALPASFYLSSRPAWFSTRWGTPPWPPIGPNVTGGPGPSGRAYLIPAALCYYNSPVNPDGPLIFNATSCYGKPQPVPPTFLYPGRNAPGWQ